jgi:hypothetical protein
MLRRFRERWKAFAEEAFSTFRRSDMVAHTHDSSPARVRPPHYLCTELSHRPFYLHTLLRRFPAKNLPVLLVCLGRSCVVASVT